MHLCWVQLVHVPGQTFDEDGQRKVLGYFPLNLNESNWTIDVETPLNLVGFQSFSNKLPAFNHFSPPTHRLLGAIEGGQRTRA